jgi:hypothetical protein
MTKRSTIAVSLAATLIGGGLLHAQPGDAPSTDEPRGPDAVLLGEKAVELPPREMAQRASEMIREMEKHHRGVLGLQATAKQAKDVIKLNCVNENLLAVKQLLNIAEAAENELDEAIIQGDRDAQTHQFSQITLTYERSTTARNEAQACIGEELHFVGKNDVEVNGPAIRFDPTDDPDLGNPSGEDPFSPAVTLEDPAFASPFMPN